MTQFQTSDHQPRPAKSRCVVVTGAARGIGRGIAECFAQQGDNLVIVDLNSDETEQTAGQIMKQFNVKALPCACDVTDRTQVQRMAGGAIAAFGGIDVLVNNAGICPFIHVMQISDEVFRKTVEVDLIGPFVCTQVIAAHMIEHAAGGRIIDITSLNEDFTGPNQADYGSAKGGLRVQMKAFCQALGPHGITCNAVAPGIMLTEMTRKPLERPGVMERFEKRIPVGRVGRPADIGWACVFLASQGAAYISGTTIRVDGGFTASCQ